MTYCDLFQNFIRYLLSIKFRLMQPNISYVKWAALRKKVPNLMSCCHTKRRTGVCGKNVKILSKNEVHHKYFYQGNNETWLAAMTQDRDLFVWRSSNVHKHWAFKWRWCSVQISRNNKWYRVDYSLSIEWNPTLT